MRYLSGGKNAGSHYVTKQLFYAFGFYGSMLQPELRAAFYRVLSRVSGESAVEVSMNGHTYYGFRDLATNAGALYLLADPSTGEAVGELLGPNQVELWTAAVATTDGVRP